MENDGTMMLTTNWAPPSDNCTRRDRSLLVEKDGTIMLTTNWAKSLLYHLNFVNRTGRSAAKTTVPNSEELKEQHLLDIKAVMVMEDVPSESVMNWDHTGIGIILELVLSRCPHGTMELKWSKGVNVVGISDKRQFTFILCGSMKGELLPFQLTYEGKTKALLLYYKFPAGWQIVTFTGLIINPIKTKQMNTYKIL